jgi:hypothetical protein
VSTEMLENTQPFYHVHVQLGLPIADSE